MREVRATSLPRFGPPSNRFLISAGGKPHSLATGLASPWAPSSLTRTSFASMSGATRRSALPEWILKPPCASELKVMPISTQKYRATDISGDYAALARALGAYGERVTTPEEIVPAIKRGIAETKAGRPALLEFITAKETAISKFV